MKIILKYLDSNMKWILSSIAVGIIAGVLTNTFWEALIFIIAIHLFFIFNKKSKL